MRVVAVPVRTSVTTSITRPSDDITEVPGEKCAEWAEEEGDADRGEREQQCDLLACGLEEELSEHQPRARRVDEEVVPLDDGADGRREGDSTL